MIASEVELMDRHRLAHEVLLPATASSELTPQLRELLARGCRSVLLGETREEYLQRAMAPARRQRETPALLRELTAAIATSVGPSVVAVDYELGGIQRLEHVAAPLPSAEEAARMSIEELVERAQGTGEDLAAIGVTLTLGPVVDVVRGANPWLERRNLGPDPALVARIGAAVVTGLQAAGVAATAKHFPGNAIVPTDPATDEARVETGIEELQERDLAPFRAVIESGVRAVMLGPAIVTAIDGARPASLSPLVVQLLRRELRFRGTIITDDLDARSILREAELGVVAVEAVAAGADLLLISEDEAATCAAAIAAAVDRGELAAERLDEAANNVRRLASPAAGLEQSAE